MPAPQNNPGCFVAQGPIRNVGVGLRAPHYHYVESNKPDIAWFEVLIDNYLGKGGSPVYHLQQISELYPLTFHGVGMSLGSTDSIDWDYLRRLKSMIGQFNPAWVSDHLCWTGAGGQFAHDLLPLPYTEEAVDHVSERISQIQDYLQQQILVENVSSYLNYSHSVLDEWDFLAAVAEKADCYILLDINNIHVSAHNHGFDAGQYLQAIPEGRVREMHLAGYEDMTTHLLDTHGEKVHAPVWELYRRALRRFGSVPTLIEWDNNIPEFPVLADEAAQAGNIMKEVEHETARAATAVNA